MIQFQCKELKQDKKNIQKHQVFFYSNDVSRFPYNFWVLLPEKNTLRVNSQKELKKVMLHSWELTWHSPWKWMLWNSYDRFLLGAWPIFRGQWLLVLGSVDVSPSSLSPESNLVRLIFIQGIIKDSTVQSDPGNPSMPKTGEVPGPRHSGCSWCIPPLPNWENLRWISRVHPFGTAPTNQFTPPRV